MKTMRNKNRVKKHHSRKKTCNTSAPSRRNSNQVSLTVQRKHSHPFRRFLAGVAAVLMIMVCSFGFGSFFASAHGNTTEETVEYKYYKSIQIEEGDTFWSIAKEYMSPDYESIYDYMEELASINNLNIKEAEHLTPGDYVLVAYLDTDFQE